MKDNHVPLHLLPEGAVARVVALTAGGSARRRMLDLGLITGTRVEAVQKSPSGDPRAYHVRGAVYALRSEDASNVLVEVCSEGQLSY